MLLILFLQIQAVVQQTCKVISDYPTMLYPSNANQFLQPLDEFFTGQGLTYSVNGTYQFSTSQSIAQSTTTSSPFPTNYHLIDDVSQFDWKNPNVQTGSMVALIEYNSSYHIYEYNPDQKVKWTLSIKEFSTTSTVLCTRISYIFENDLIVSCIDLATYRQIFYYFQRISISILTRYPGIPIIIQTAIIQPKSLEFSSFQVLNDQGRGVYVACVYGEYYNPKTLTYIYSVSLKPSKTDPLHFEYKYVGQQEVSCYGTYFSSPHELYLLLDEKLVHFSTRTQRHLDHKLTVKNPQAMGVYKETYTDGTYILLFTIITTKDVIHYSTTDKLFSNQKASLPSSFQTNIKTKVYVNPLYSVITDGQTVAAYPNKFQEIESYHQFGYVYSQTYNIQHLVVFFDILSSTYYVFDNTQEYTIQITKPYLYSLETLSTSTDIVTFTINAYDGTANCEASVSYQLIPQADVTTFVVETTKKQREEPYLLFNSQSKLIEIGNQFLGANIYYQAVVTQILKSDDEDENDEGDENKQPKQDVQEPEQPKATVLTYNQIDITGSRIIASFSYTYQVDDDSYLIFSQVTSKLDTIYIQKCKFLACIQTFSLQAYNGAITSIAATISDDIILHLSIAYNNLIYTYVLDYNNLNIAYQQHNINLANELSNQNILVENLYYLSDALLVLTSTPNVIICYNSILRQQYTLSGNQIMPRQIFINTNIYADTYFIDNQDTLMIVKHAKYFDPSDLSVEHYSYNIVENFTYPNSYKQQQISLGLVEQGFYLIQISGTTQNVYFYPYSYMYYQLTSTKKLTYQIQTVALSNYNIIIQQPIVSQVSQNNIFYISVLNGNTNQILALKYSPYEFNQLYQAITVEYIPNYLNIITIQRDVNQFRDSQLEFRYDIILAQVNNANVIQIIQVFYDTLLLFTPNVQLNALDTFDIDITAWANQQNDLEESATITRSAKVTKQILGIIKRTDEIKHIQTVIGSIFFIDTNPADYFYGYSQNYIVLNKIGYRQEFQEAYLTCQQKDKANQVIKNNVVQPMMLQEAKYPLQYSAITSGILSDADEIQTFFQSGRAVYILFKLEAFYLYQIPTPLTSICKFIFITSDTGFLISVCSNQDDTFLYYYNGTDSSNRTIIQSSGYELINTPLPLLQSAEYNYNQLCLVYSDYIIIMHIIATNVSLTTDIYHKFTYSYPIKSSSLVFVNLDSNATFINTTIDNYTAKMGVGCVLLYQNSLIEFQYFDENNDEFSAFVAYQSLLPNGLDMLSIRAYLTGWITETYISIPIILSTSQQSYLFQIIVPTFERIGSANAQLIYTLIPFDRYETIGVYVENDTIVGVFYTDSNKDGDTEYIIGLYGIPTIKDFVNDITMNIKFKAEKVYQHVGQEVGFIGFQNVTNQTISNFILSPNATFFYQVKQTQSTQSFSYIYLLNKIKLTINQVDCINSDSIRHTLNITKVELIATNNEIIDVSTNTFDINNQYPVYTFMDTEDRKRNFWWQFGFGALFFMIIIGVLGYLCVNSSGLIVYEERLLQVEMNE